MILIWPEFLVLLALIPLFVALYWWVQHRRRRVVLRYSSLALIQAALPRRPHWRRHVPPILFLLALVVLIVAFTRPTLVSSIPAGQATVILAIDVSPSMGYTDMQPTRLSVAKAAALAFIQCEEATTQIGIVTFSSDAKLILPPTTEQAVLRSAIQSLTLGQQTAIGSGILTSLEALEQVGWQMGLPGNGEKLNGSASIPSRKSSAAPGIIVVLTDGANNCCEPPLKAAQLAAERGVRVYTIGFGGKTAFPRPSDPEGNQPNPTTTNTEWLSAVPGIDEELLRQIAVKTGGMYFTATSASELNNVFVSLPTRRIVKKEIQEISVIFIALGMLFVTTAMLLSLRWHPIP